MSDVTGGSVHRAAAGTERSRAPRPVPWSPVFAGTGPSAPVAGAGDLAPLAATAAASAPQGPDRDAGSPGGPAVPTGRPLESPTGGTASPTDRSASQAGSVGRPEAAGPPASPASPESGPAATGSRPEGAGVPAPGTATDTATDTAPDTATDTAPDTATDTASDSTTPAPPRRRTRRVLVGVVAGVVAVGAGTALALGLLDGDREPAAPTPEAVVLPSPTPTVAPVARQPVSAFADSLPGSVLGYALTSLVEEPTLLAAGALEGYRLDYSDGGTGTLTVTGGQWETDAEAATALAAATATAGAAAVPVTDGEPTSGEVQVGGAVVGTWTLTQAPDGTGTVTWSNGTVVLQATAPADVVRDVYAAYPY